MRFNCFTTTLLAACMMPLTTLAVPWGYTEENGPARWGEISKAYATCQTGINQSPIDIQTTTTSKLGLPALNMQYVDGPTRFRSINHTLQATMSSYASNSIEIDETLYYLKQFDFHAPSEHTLNGKTYPLEMQLLHKNQSGDIAIVAWVNRTRRFKICGSPFQPWRTAAWTSSRRSISTSFYPTIKPTGATVVR